jgi:hypothetical protein
MQAESLDVGDFQSDSRENSIKMNKAMPFFEHKTKAVTRIRLRGDWTSGKHQELMITLSGDILLRISRTNGEDTFQIGAVEEGRSKIPMPTLINRPIAGIKKTCGDALQAFGEVHRRHPKYEQADCQAFAKDVLLLLDPGAKSEFKTTSVEDDFM